MKKTFFVVSLILMSVGLINGQATSQTDEEKEARVASERAMDNRVDTLRNNGKQIYIRDRYKKDQIFLDIIRPLYRDDLTDAEKTLLAPNQDDLTKYAQFLDEKNTGLIKLTKDIGCDGGTEIVVAKPKCEEYRMPGAGASYSFRADRYSMKRLADITFTGKNFDTVGLVKHGILLNIGDVPLEDVNLKTKELETIVTFEPVKDFEQAELFAGILKKGVKVGNLVFADSLKVKVNNTYALRSIAYRAIVPRRVQDTTYDEFDFDERDDVIIVFRVVRLDKDESVTILFKELKKKRAPKMVLPQKFQ
jgi:hypothetical protein